MNTLKQLQEKDWTVDTDDQNRNFIKYKDGRREFIGDDWKIICFLHKKVCDSYQQTTLAYNAGKADMLDTVLKEIEGIPRKKSAKDMPYGSVDAYVGFNTALNEVKNKLLDNKTLQDNK